MKANISEPNVKKVFLKKSLSLYLQIYVLKNRNTLYAIGEIKHTPLGKFMNTITAVLPFQSQLVLENTLRPILQSPLIEKVIVVHDGAFTAQLPKCEGIKGVSITAGNTLNKLIETIEAGFLLVVNQSHEIQIPPGTLERLIDVAAATDAGMVYSDYLEKRNGKLAEHPVNPYQTGSIRDEFDFGQMLLFSISAIHRALRKFGPIADVRYAGLYDLRLKVAIDNRFFHIREFLYTVIDLEIETDKKTSSGESIFDYVDHRNQAAQKEMELVVTQHLKYINDFLDPQFMKVPVTEDSFPVEASVVIPVRNRVKTIADAVKSALSQKTDFPFNVIVVDNHSADGTTTALAALAGQYPAIKHLIPSRLDLSIGGCWNEAVFSEFCGRYAVQLDSDDLYGSPETLQKIIAMFRKGDFAMIIGSYTLVNESLREIPPGLIDHREWTDDNGRNNALRINGLGAPRAFDTGLLRKIGFPNVGYGEDYAVALRVSRHYRIGRIYESLYLCRRWEGNTDAALTIEKRNRNDAYKDSIRTIEIMVRQKLVRNKNT